MRRSTIFCKHHNSERDNKTCAAGVPYESFRGMPFDKRPCFSEDGNPRPGCDLVQLPTAQELAAEDAWLKEQDQKHGTARQAIVAACGGPWKRGMASMRGVIDCPACGAVKSLTYSRSGYNGHIHAKCATKGCVSWME